MVFLSVLLFALGLVLSPQIPTSCAWGGSADKVLLKDIEVLTLRTGQWTAGRRSQGVPQLACVGGSAGCSAFQPQVVQCYNRGSDGTDVQWECKTDMDNAYRFGKVEVTCEGYDYPDDPYVLKGSCGLEYTMDLTKEGHQHQQQHNYYGGGSNQGPSASYGWKVDPNPNYSRWQQYTNMACFIIVCIIVYAIYKTCIAPSVANRQYSPTDDDYPSGQGPGTRQPPPYGFRNPFSASGNSDHASDSCGSGARTAGAGPAGGGFWTGAATGGLLGYLFGRNNNHTNTMYGQPRPSTSYGFRSGPSWGGSFGGGSSSSSSSGTRTASGFGGTRRR